MNRDFDAADERQLAQRGIPLDEARRQIEHLACGPRHAELVRPCTIGDGIVRLAESDLPRLIALADAAADRFTRFVPASGAATRMFAALRGRDEAAAQELATFLSRVTDLALHEDLAREMRRRGADLAAALEAGDHPTILDALLDARGLDLERRPKALIPFHAYPEGGRTAFEEHLVESAGQASGRGRCRLHFTVGGDHLETFERFAREVLPAYERRLGVRFDVDFSIQDPSTDTLALDADGRPARDAEGRLILRPGGHGALIENLGRLGADLVSIRNIDNVQPDRVKPEATRLRRALAGQLLVELERQVGDRPLRVCAVVPNRGEPGGGPFWVRDRNGRIAPQIVETAQVDPRDPAQQRILAAASHFNPVDLVCSMRDRTGRPFDLARFVDPDGAIVSTKIEAGRPVRVLERPGLWNGAMAGWDTIFVELPLFTFSPVKSVIDLLRDEHRV
jgi:hypothetical protein